MIKKARWIFVVAGTALTFIVFACLHWSQQFRGFPHLEARDAASWHSYGGDWQLRDGIYTNRADGRGDKLVGGPVTQGDYSVSADLRFDTAPEDPSFGDAGLLLRVLDPSVGVDALRGYYAALRLDDHMLLIGTMTFGFREQATASFPHELRTGHWYHLTFSSRGCTFHARAEDMDARESVDLSYVEQACDPLRGQVGLRSYYAKTSWRDLQVKRLR